MTIRTAPLAPATNLEFAFAGRTVVVTGAAQGLGLSIARRFHEGGARVAAWDLAPGEAAGDDRWLSVGVDVADANSVAAGLKATADAFGSPDIVVNNAGITRDGVVWKLTDRAWSDVLRVHLDGTFNVTRACIPAMRERDWGRIVNVTSYTGLHGNIGQANYAAAKGGIIALTKAVAKETARFGITVNAISPNAETPMVAAVPSAQKAALTDLVPMARFADPSEIAPAVCFLASAEASYITGALLPIDGGLSM